MATTKLPDEPEVIVGRYALLEAQARTGEGVASQLGGFDCAWFGTGVLLDRGAFAYVETGSALEDRVGEYLRLSYEGRRVVVYVVGRVDEVGIPLMVARRVFLALAPLALRSVRVNVEGIA